MTFGHPVVPPFSLLALPWILPLAMALAASAADPVPPAGAAGAAPSAARAFEPAAPVLPAEVVAALQEGRTADAIAALDALAKAPGATADDRAYAALIGGIARRLGGKLDDARAVLAAALEAAPQGRWAAKLRGELTTVELAAGRFAEAEALARAQAEGLLAADRKDRLAGIYETFARRLLKPAEPVVPPDPEGAHGLFEQGRALARGTPLRARLLLAMARASEEADNHDRAIAEFQAYLDEYKEEAGLAADLDAARYGLGEAQLGAGQLVPARLTWEALVRAPKGADAARLVGDAMFGLSRTFGIPMPPDDTQLNLGVAALRRFLKAQPSHPLAVQAAYDIGASYLNRGRSQEALDALRAFLKGDQEQAAGDEAGRTRAELRMTATFQIALILQGQGRHAEAIEAFQGYLAQYPNGPQSADAQRAILDVRLAVADALERGGEHAQARAAWTEFAAANPLDARVPEALYRAGRSFLLETPKQIDPAVAAWEALAGKFPGTEPAGHAQFDTAALFEDEKADPAAAIERFRKIEVEPWKSRAAQRVAVMEQKTLVVVTPRPFRSGETGQLQVTTRNLETLSFAAFRLDPEAYFRKKHQLAGVESLDIALVAPDAEWTVTVPGFKKYRPIESKFDLKVELPGVYVVRVTDEKTLQATTLVVGSDVDAIVKASRQQVLVFAQDMKTGKGRAGARVLVSEGSEILLDGKTGPDGVLLADWPKVRPEQGGDFRTLILDGEHAAGTALGNPGGVVQGLSPRAYLYTDRPAYRPGQTVQLRGVVREVKDGQYSAPEGAGYRLEVLDSRGRPFVADAVTLSPFGTFDATVKLDAAAPLGTYRVRVFQPGKSEFAGEFNVQAYQLQKVEVTIDLPRTVYYRGETIEGAVVAKYQYGTPLAGRDVQVALPDGSTLAGTTDSAGRFPFKVATDGFGEAQTLAIGAANPSEGVGASANVAVALQGFRIDLDTARTVYLDAEPFAVAVKTLDALGNPIGAELTARVIKRVAARPGVPAAEREVSSTKVATDPKTGAATLNLKVDDREGGAHVVRVTGTDRFGNGIVGERALTISGTEDAQRLRFLADRQRFRVGEEAAVRLVNRGPAGTALLAWEADRILSYKLVPVAEGENRVAWEVAGAQFPNFTLTAARMADTKFHEARLDLDVVRELAVTVKPAKERYAPNEEISLEVETRDQLGRPVAAEVGVALVDEALLRLFADPLPSIGDYFYNQRRTGAFRTVATNTFRYAPPTVPVPSAVVEEDQRRAALASDSVARGAVLDAAKDQVALALPMAPPAAAPAPVSADSDMGGGMGGMGGMPGLEAGQNAARNRLARGMTLRSGVDPQVAAKRKAGAVRDGLYFRLDAEKEEALAESASPGEPAGPPRQAFVETAYWNPRVVTGADGKGRVTFKAPTALSRYRFSARGTTGSDTLVGQATAGIQVRRDFFVELKTPASLTQGDRPRFVARLHHGGVTGQATVTLKAYAGGREATFPKTLDLKGDGVEEVRFDPFEVPEGDVVRLTATARCGDASDEIVQEVPIRPWGVQAYASASGTTSDDATALVSLPPGRAYTNPELLVVLSPTVRRMIVELALGRDAYPLLREARVFCPPPPDTLADRASDLIAAASALSYLRAIKGADAPEAARLGDRIRGIAAELVTLQGEDGGWPWVAGTAGQARPSERLTAARVVWGLALAESVGLLPDPKALDRGVAYLNAAFAATDAADSETRAVLLHALSTRRAASFEAANALNRNRQALSDPALAYLALGFANLDRDGLANEVLGVLVPRAKAEAVAPGLPSRVYWSGETRHAGVRGAAEATALAALALSRSRADAPELRGAIAWLEAHRVGNGWLPHAAKGPALAALGAYHARGEIAEDRYRLVVSVNGQEVHRAEVNGPAAGAAIAVPRAAIQPGGENRVRFDIEGRGTYSYTVTLGGFTRDFKPDQDVAGRPFVVSRRAILPAEPTLDGKTLPVGFGVAVGASYFENAATKVAEGGRARIRIDAYRVNQPGQPAWERDFLILEDSLPAGTTLVEGSVQTTAAHFEVDDGAIRFYFAPDQEPGQTAYDVFGTLPGQYRTVPPLLSSAYEPGRRHLAAAGGYDLRVLAPGEPNDDPYKATPDELYARGKALYDAGKLANAAEPLESLWGAYTLRDDVAKDAARMLLFIHLQTGDARKIVQYFEILKEKMPELVVPFDKLLLVGKAYRDLGEFERATIVWRGVTEASFLEDARLGELLRQRGQRLEGLAMLLDQWRAYPNLASIESDFFGLAQLAAGYAAEAVNDPGLRVELAAAGKSRSDLLLQAIRLTQVFLAQAPKNPVADEASLALVGNFLELEDFPSVVKLSERFAALYPKSTFLDSFQYSEALGRFHLGEYDRAIEVADAIAKATYKDANGIDQPSPNKWQALYIIGQIHDARREPAKAVPYYRQVADRFTDAAEALKAFTRKGLSLPEVSVIRPETPKVAAADPRGVFRNVAVARAADTPDPRFPDKVKLTYRNIAEVDIKVYPVDLLRLYLTRRNLDGIAGIDLAGITPLAERTVKLGDGEDFAEKTRELQLPLAKEGAYLVMVRGGDLYASGIVLVSPLELEVVEEPGNGRVRVVVRDAFTRSPVPKVQVKVIGSNNGTFFSGETDLRGVYVAEGVLGQVTALARQDAPDRKDAPRYAFHRGTVGVGTPPPPPQPATPSDKPAEAKQLGDQTLELNIMIQNNDNRVRQLERLEKRYNAPAPAGAGVGTFK
jgi:uncharacterized protein YfaS (alpha-2-macroglobulin family)/TolA-binding protein